MPVEILDLRMLGDSAILVCFEQRIDEPTNRKVIALRDAINDADIPGVTFLVPAYCSLSVGFDPLAVERETLVLQIRSSAAAVDVPDQDQPPEVLTIPVCYDPEYGIDLLEVTRQTGLDADEVIARHTSQTYHVFMLGFLPGFAYLGPLPAELECPRRKTARMHVPARAVAIAGRQTAIYPAVSPGGWHIIGRTPIAPFDPQRVQPFLFRPGDKVEFRSISIEEYKRS